jgi:hypothetical protein
VCYAMLGSTPLICLNVVFSNKTLERLNKKLKSTNNGNIVLLPNLMKSCLKIVSFLLVIQKNFFMKKILAVLFKVFCCNST